MKGVQFLTKFNLFLEDTELVSSKKDSSGRFACQIELEAKLWAFMNSVLQLVCDDITTIQKHKHLNQLRVKQLFGKNLKSSHFTKKNMESSKKQTTNMLDIRFTIMINEEYLSTSLGWRRKRLV